jgi:hypothetical protein
MRSGGLAVLAFALLVGCARGRALNQQGDGDGSVQADAPDVQGDAPADVAPIDVAIDMPPPHPDAPPVDAPPIVPDACVPQQLEKLANPALDLAPAGMGWTQVTLPDLPGGPYPLITADGFAPQSAPNKAWLGGASGSDASPQHSTLTDQLFQDFAIPGDTTKIVITGFFAVGTTESGGTVFDTFTFDVTQQNGTPIENVLKLNNTMPQGAFTAFTKTISAGGLAQMVGKTVRLRATSTNDFINHSNFFLDTLSVKATHCP